MSMEKVQQEEEEKKEEVWVGDPLLCNGSVTLLPAQGEREKDTIILHAPVCTLTRLPFFSSSLADRWQASVSLEAPFTSSVTTLTSPCHYAWVICWSSSPRPFPQFLFQNPSDALCILQMANHLLACECFEAAMVYLAAVSMTLEEEDAVRSFFLNHDHITPPSPELSARLGLQGGQNLGLNALGALTENLKEWLLTAVEDQVSCSVDSLSFRYYRGVCMEMICANLSSKVPSAVHEAVQDALAQFWTFYNSQLQKSLKNRRATCTFYIWLWLTDIILEHTNSKDPVHVILRL